MDIIAFVRKCVNEKCNVNLYSYIKIKQVDTTGVAPLKSGTVYIDSKDKARILNSEYVSVFSVDKGDIPTIHAKYSESLITSILTCYQ